MNIFARFLIISALAIPVSGFGQSDEPLELTEDMRVSQLSLFKDFVALNQQMVQWEGRENHPEAQALLKKIRDNKKDLVLDAIFSGMALEHAQFFTERISSEQRFPPLSVRQTQVVFPLQGKTLEASLNEPLLIFSVHVSAYAWAEDERPQTVRNQGRRFQVHFIVDRAKLLTNAPGAIETRIVCASNFRSLKNELMTGLRARDICYAFKPETVFLFDEEHLKSPSGPNLEFAYLSARDANSDVIDGVVSAPTRSPQWPGYISTASPTIAVPEEELFQPGRPRRNFFRRRASTANGQPYVPRDPNWPPFARQLLDRNRHDLSFLLGRPTEETDRKKCAELFTEPSPTGT